METPPDIRDLERLMMEGHEEATIFSVMSSPCNCALDTQFSGTR